MALALGPILERSFIQSLYLTQGDLLEILTRPIAGTMIFIALLVVLIPFIQRIYKNLFRKN
jgi:TctA family transporter